MFVDELTTGKTWTWGIYSQRRVRLNSQRNHMHELCKKIPYFGILLSLNVIKYF